MGSLAFIVGVLLLACLLIGLVGALMPIRARGMRGDSGGPGGTSGALGELVEVFQPSRIHTTEELERKRLDIVQTPGAAPGTAVDLDARTAVIDLSNPRHQTR